MCERTSKKSTKEATTLLLFCTAYVLNNMLVCSNANTVITTTLYFYIKGLTEELKSIPAFFGFFYFRNNILLLCCLYSYKNVVKEAADVLHFSQFFLGLQRKRFLKKKKKMLCIRSLCTAQRLVLRLRMEKCLKRDQVISLLE